MRERRHKATAQEQAISATTLGSARARRPAVTAGAGAAGRKQAVGHAAAADAGAARNCNEGGAKWRVVGGEVRARGILANLLDAARARGRAVAADAGAEQNVRPRQDQLQRWEQPCEKRRAQWQRTLVLGTTRGWAAQTQRWEQPVREGGAQWPRTVRKRLLREWEAVVEPDGCTPCEKAGTRETSSATMRGCARARNVGEIAGAQRYQLSGNGSSCEKAGSGSSYSDAISSCEKGAGVHSRLARNRPFQGHVGKLNWSPREGLG